MKPQPTTFDSIVERMDGKPTPPMVVYCGSTSKCQAQFRRAALYDTIRSEPRMFMTIGCSVLTDAQIVQSGVGMNKDTLDELHFWKIFTAARMARLTGTISEICILDLTDDGEIYYGESTRREMDYATHLIEIGCHLTLRFWSQEQDAVRQVLRDIAL